MRSQERMHRMLMPMKAKSILVILFFILSLLCRLAYAEPYVNLRNGDRGNDVRQLQQALSSIGYDIGDVDGRFGDKTEAAVRAFQKAAKLRVDGVAGRETLTQLYRQAGESMQPSIPNSGRVSFGGNYNSIKKSSSADRIRLLQQGLNAVGYSLSVDGRFGPRTLSAILAFQQANALKVDGIAGRQTLLALEGKSSVNQAAQSLRMGDSGQEVRLLQEKLKETGYYLGALDGKFGSGTKAAVRAFQKAHGLKVDGVAGSQTMARLWAVQPTAVPTAAPAPTPTATPKPQVTPSPDTGITLRKGATGQAVVSLQRALAFLDYNTSTLGKYESMTASAVRAFQKKNGLSVDGIAGPQVLTALYSGRAVKGDSPAGISVETGQMAGPAFKDVQLLHWYRDIKPTLKNGQRLLVYDPATGLAWTLRIMSCGHHADADPLTATDTAILYRAFGNHNEWGPKPVYVRLPDGRWTVAGTHNMPHENNGIKDNNFDGHTCVHFFRTMSEAQQFDPKDGVRNQNTIRQFWKDTRGVDIGEDII